ncbi:MAG: S8 family serine peptidase, partial [Candidatus Hodarchaeota archaeon]
FPYTVYSNEIDPDLYHYTNSTGYELPGMAPGAKIQAIKSGQRRSVFTSTVLAYLWSGGFDYNPATNKWEFTGDHYANISSNSWGGSRVAMASSLAEFIPLVRDVLSIPGFYDPAYKGQLFVHSAGNEGSAMQTVAAQSAAELSVGGSAMNTYNEPNYGIPQGTNHSLPFTSKGPTNLGFPKPDVLAPGFLVASPAPLWWYYDTIGAANQSFYWWSGSSASCPFGAGTAALVMEAYYDAHGVMATPDVIKSIIISTAKDRGYNPAIQGSGLIDAYRAVQLARQQATADGTPLLWTTTTTSFREVAKLVNESAVAAFEAGGLFHLYADSLPGGNTTDPIANHPGLTNDYLDASLYLGLIARGASKTGSIHTEDGVGAGVDSVVAKQFKETTTITFTFTTTTDYNEQDVGLGPIQPIVLKNELTSGEYTAFKAADMVWIHVSMSQSDYGTSGAYFLGCTLNDWHDDGDSVLEYENKTTAQTGEIYELMRQLGAINTWNLQVGYPGDAFPWDNPTIIVRSNDDVTPTQFAGVDLTVRVRMFTLEDWSDITITETSGGAKTDWNVTATMAADADPDVYEGVLVITKGTTTRHMPLGFMATAAIPKGPNELILGGAPTNDSHDAYAYYIPGDLTFEGSSLHTFGLTLNDASATFLAVNARILFYS